MQQRCEAEIGARNEMSCEVRLAEYLRRAPIPLRGGDSSVVLGIVRKILLNSIIFAPHRRSATAGR